MTAAGYDPGKYTDVMVDLETLGTAPGSAIISLGAVMFAPGLPEDEWATYEALIQARSCTAIGLTQDPDTMAWWRQQDPAAREVFDASLDGQGEHVVTVLLAFARFFPVGAMLWGNGANFDNTLLAAAYRAAAVPTPWPYWNDACYRTMKNQFDMVPRPLFQGTQHKALDDALHQTRHLVHILEYKSRLAAAYYKTLADGVNNAPAGVVSIDRGEGGD